MPIAEVRVGSQDSLVQIVIFEQTVPAEQYDPSNGDLVIPVVVHVIQNDEGTLGWIDRATIEQQIRILNDDFSGVGSVQH